MALSVFDDLEAMVAAVAGENEPPTEPTPFRDPFLHDASEGPAMVRLPGGVFTMGQDDSPYDDERPAHAVRLAAFSIGQYPVTFAEYDRFCEATGRDKPADGGWGRGDRPVVNVSWEDAQAYCAWLGEQTGEPYRLPTEAEWEYACRAGSHTPWSCGDDEAALADHVWCSQNAGGRTHPVGEKRPNPWQLHDMHGNVWEWCQDWYASRVYQQRASELQQRSAARPKASAEAEPADEPLAIRQPSGPASGSRRVVRGGSWRFDASHCSSTLRLKYPPSSRLDNLGFRLARTGPWCSDPGTLDCPDPLPEPLPEPGLEPQPERPQAAEAAAQHPAAPAPPTQDDPPGDPPPPPEVFRDRFRIIQRDGTEQTLDAPELVRLPGGTFIMGDERGLDRERPVHEVRLDAFAIGRTPVTWGQYRHFCEATDAHWPEWLEPGSRYHLETGSDGYYRSHGVAADALDLPVVGIAWDDAYAYCAWLSEQTGERYALPTEAQSEYACRAGTATRWSCGDDEHTLADHAWYAANADAKLHPVAQKRPNPWRVHDMHGNCWEWCADWFGEDGYQQRGVSPGQAREGARMGTGADADVPEQHTSQAEHTTSDNPTGPESGTTRVLRGGTWRLDAGHCRSAYRFSRRPSIRLAYVGFRVSRSV